MEQLPCSRLLRASIRQLPSEAVLWTRLERARWASDPTCPNCAAQQGVARLLCPRTEPYHYRCEPCGLLFSVLHELPIELPIEQVGISLRAWATLMLAMAQMGGRCSQQVVGSWVRVPPAQFRMMQDQLLYTLRHNMWAVQALCGPLAEPESLNGLRDCQPVARSRLHSSLKA